MLRWFHPAVVHFAVAFLATAAVAGAVGYLLDRERWRAAAHGLLVLGAASLVPTIVTGYLAANSVVAGAGATAVLDAHEAAGWRLAGVVLVGLLAIAWFRGSVPPRVRRPAGLWWLLLLAAVAHAAWLGGRLVYGYGVGVST